LRVNLGWNRSMGHRMPRYFVDLVMGREVSTDDEGMELADMAAVRKEVETTIREIIADSVRSGREIGDGEIRVRDIKDKKILAMKFRDVIL